MLHDGPIMAAAAHLTITITGQAGHAAMPHLTADPVQGAAHIIIALNAIVARNIDPLDSAVISICTMRAGQAMNQIPETVTLGGTFRALTPEVMQALETRIRAAVTHTAEAFGLNATVNIDARLAPTVNHKAEADLAAATAISSGLKLRRDMAPTMGAEDFGRFLLEIPGAYAWIGNGPSASLHNPNFDYNDEILPIAANYLAAIAKTALA
jgi:hippurate hydrolase